MYSFRAIDQLNNQATFKKLSPEALITICKNTTCCLRVYFGMGNIGNTNHRLTDASKFNPIQEGRVCDYKIKALI